MPHFSMGRFALSSKLSGNLAIHFGEYVPNFGTKQSHNSDHNDGHESENNRIFDKALARFIWCKKHNDILSK